VGHRGFAERGFDIVRIFDTDRAKIGQALDGRQIEDAAQLEAVLAADPVDMAVIVTPAEAAQQAADRLVALGVRSILNVAPVQLVVPATVEVRSVNLALELEALSFALAGAGSDPGAHASLG
jgi:redox-sensing transcriptional repressor